MNDDKLNQLEHDCADLRIGLEELLSDKEPERKSLRYLATSDVLRLLRSYEAIGPEGRSALLRQATIELVRLVAQRTTKSRCVSQDELEQFIGERIEQASPSDSWHPYYQCKLHDPDVDQAFFPDGRAWYILGSVESFYGWAQNATDVYRSVSRDHPVDCFSPEEYLASKDQSLRHSALLEHRGWVNSKMASYFEELLQDWQSNFLQKLFKDLEDTQLTNVNRQVE